MGKRSPLLWYALLLFLGLASSAHAAERRFAIVVRTWPGKLVGLTRNADLNWQINDYFCAAEVRARLEEEKEYIVCGEIIRVTQKGIIVHISGSRRNLLVSDKVEIEKVDARQFREIGLLEERFSNPIPHYDRRTFGLGIDYLFPMIAFEQGISAHWTIDFRITYVSMTAPRGQRVGGVGTYFNLSYYPDRLFRGWWFLGGISTWFTYITDPTITTPVSAGREKQVMLAVLGGAGYKLLLWDRLTLGAALGFRFTLNPNTAKFDTGYSPFMPVAIAEVGLRF